MPRTILALLFACLATFALTEAAYAVGGLRGGATVPRRPTVRAQFYPWHGAYAHTEYGAPVALVVPPTVRLQTNWSWGTGSSRIQRVDHQFGRNWPGPYSGGQGFLWTPAWPSDTTQFGVYPVRAPW
jgi:hypothetical protein